MTSGITVHLAQVPYLGLRPFEVDEADIFFGRERQTDELLRRLSQTYFLPIVGPSGCGKSSLIRAGLLASLEAGFIVEAGGRWRILTMMPRNRPIQELAHAILQRLEEPDESKLVALQSVLRSGPRGLIEALQEIAVEPGENLLLLVDQFEEIFRFRDQLAAPALADGPDLQHQKRKDEADAFVALLLETVKQRAAYVVLTMRSDFLRDCSLFAGLPEALNKSIYLTPRLDRDDLQSAIEEPARVLGGSLQPDLVRQLINDARSNQDQLPLMQHVLMRMWSDVIRTRPQAPPELTLDDYGRVGALSKALCQDADNAFEKELTPEQQKIAEVLFKALCVRSGSERDTRAPAQLDHVAKMAAVKWEEVAAVVEIFRGANRYFLSPRSGPLAPDTVLDITHESLIRNWKRLSHWVEEEALSAETYERLVRDAEDWKQGGDLLSPIRLANVTAWKDLHDPTETWSQRYGGQFALATEYLEASRIHREKEIEEAALAQQRLFVKENKIKVLGTVLGLALVVTAFAVYQTFRASSQTNLAKKQTTVARQQTKLAEEKTAAADVNYGSALAIKAQLEWRSRKPLSAWPYAVEFPLHNKELTLAQNIPEPSIQYYRQIPHKSEVLALAISPDGKSLAAALNDGSIDLVDPQTGAITRNFPASLPQTTDATSSVAASPGSGKGDSAELAFSPDGQTLYFLRRQFGLEIRNLADGKLLSFSEAFPAFPSASKITSFAIDPSGAFALGLEDGTLIFRRDGLAGWVTATLQATDSQDRAPQQSQRPVGKGLAESKQSRSTIISLGFSPDGNTIAGISEDKKTLRVWQVGNAELRELKVETGKTKSDSQTEAASPLSVVLFSPAADDTLILAAEDGEIDRATLKRKSGSSPGEGPSPRPSETSVPRDKKQQARSFRSSSEQVAPQLEHSADNTIELEMTANFTPPESNEIELPTVPQSGLPKEAPKPEGSVMAALDPSGENIYWVTSKGRLNAWNLENEENGDENASQLFVKAHQDRATSLAVSPSGSWLATGGLDKTIRIWRIATIESRERAAMQTIPPITTVASDPSGRIVAIGSDQEGTRVWREDKGIQPFPDLEPGSTPDWLYLSSDGKFVLASFPETAHILDAGTLQERRRIEDVLYSPFGFNGSILAAPEGERSVALWDAITGMQLGSIPEAKDELLDIMFGSSGRDLVAIASDKNRLSIWDIHDPAQPREIQTMSTGDSKIVSIDFAAAENRIAAATSGHVFLFDAKTATQLAAIPVSEPPNAIIFDAGGTLLAIGFKSGLVKVWDCNESREQTLIRESEGFADALTFISDKQIVTAGEDGRIRIWDLAGKLVKTFTGRNWRPKTPEDAARLSGLMLKDLDVRFVTPEEEGKLLIDASVPLEDERLRDYWRAARATSREFKMLEKMPEAGPEAVEKANHLARWVSSHKDSSDVGVRKRIQIANELGEGLRERLVTTRRDQAMENYRAKRYDLALVQVTQAIALQDPRTDVPNNANQTLTSETLLLLYARARILEVEHPSEAQKEFQRIVDGATQEAGSVTIKAVAQLHLAGLDPANLDAADRYFRNLVEGSPSKSIVYYYLACVSAIRSTSPGADASVRAKAATEAFEYLKKGVIAGTYGLRKFVDTTPFLAPLAQDRRFKELLELEERLRLRYEANPLEE